MEAATIIRPTDVPSPWGAEQYKQRARSDAAMARHFRLQAEGEIKDLTGSTPEALHRQADGYRRQAQVARRWALYCWAFGVETQGGYMTSEPPLRIVQVAA